MRILVVDTNPLFLKAASNFIGALPGCETVLADSGEAALRLAPAQRFDLILVDYALPRPAGLDLLGRLKLFGARPLIVLMTPEEAPLYRNACLAAGADACTAKTSLGSELPRLVSGLEHAEY